MATLLVSDYQHVTDIKQQNILPSSEKENTGEETKSVAGFGSPEIMSENDMNKSNITLEGSSGNVENDYSVSFNGDGENNLNNEEHTPVIDIHINNVVCTFNLRCHINLKKLAMEGSNVEYRREHGILNMKIRRPHVTANITSSGKVTCTGSTSEEEAKTAARRVARRLQKLGFNVRFRNFRVVNVLGTCVLPFGIKLNSFSNQYPQEASYEPELHPGVTYRIKDPKATLKIFSTGSITVTAPCVANIGTAIEHIYPLVDVFKMEANDIPHHVALRRKKIQQRYKSQQSSHCFSDDDDDDDMDEEDECDEDDLYNSEFDDDEEDSFDSDVSHD